jgi:hypothetical protein
MPRPRERVCLQEGLKLDVNRLARAGFIAPGAAKGPVAIRTGNLDQQVVLVAHSRHFGGRQWDFVCPHLNRRASVLWPVLRRSFPDLIERHAAHNCAKIFVCCQLFTWRASPNKTTNTYVIAIAI